MPGAFVNRPRERYGVWLMLARISHVARHAALLYFLACRLRVAFYSRALRTCDVCMKASERKSSREMVILTLRQMGRSRARGREKKNSASVMRR